MAEIEAKVPPKIPPEIGKLLLEPLNHAIAAGEREALKQGVPATAVIEMLLNHLASVVAMVEPAGVRAEATKSLVSSFSEMVRKHYEARMTSPGGILVAKPGDILA